jgi:hypothetical protein
MWSFIKICIICIIGINWLKEKFHRKTILSSFWLILKQQWTIEEISIFRNNSHLEYRAGLLDTILKGTHPRTIPARFGLIQFRGFRGEVLNVKVYDVRRTHGRTTTNDRSQVMAKAHMASGLWPGELKTKKKFLFNWFNSRFQRFRFFKYFPQIILW